MVKSKKLDGTRKRRRTSLEIEEEQTRTLYIRIPHTIKNADEIKSLFFGDFKVKIPRQATRYCHVIFPSIEEKIKNMKAIKKKLIDGKPIYVGPPKPMNLEKKKKPKHKKIVVPEPTDDPKLGKYLFISNIPAGVKASEIKDAFPGCLTVALLKGLINGGRQAKVKMSSTELCVHYVKNESEWPILRGKKVSVIHSKKTNNNKKNKKPKPKSTPLKIYDGESEQKDVSKSPKKSKEDKGAEDTNETSDEDNVEDEESENEEEEEEEEEEEVEKEDEESSEEE